MKHPRLLGFRHRSSFALIALATALALIASVLAPGSALAASFTVTKTADTNDGACDADCSLREAIIAANAAPGPDTITLPAGTYTLTRTGIDDTAANGDLDVTGPLAINGASQGSTVIQGGIRGGSLAIDQVFSFFPKDSAVFAVALSNLTIRFGRNPNSFSTYGSGGCFDYEGDRSGASSLSLSNVTVSNCETTDGNGGGAAISLQFGGTLSINNSIIQFNTARRSGTNSGDGGGLWLQCFNIASPANVTISNTTIRNNATSSAGGTNLGNGGGLLLYGRCTANTPPQKYQLHAVTISNNTAGNDGGGIYSYAPLTIDNAGGPTTISNNTAGNDGGGIWLDDFSDITTSTSTISKVTISGNSAGDSGGGIRLGNTTNLNELDLSYSRILNNMAQVGATGLSVYWGTANAENNWWGCSTGPNTARCDTAKVDYGGGGIGLGSMDFSPWLRVVTTATPSSLLMNETSNVLASVNTNSDNQDVSANIDLLKGLQFHWHAAFGSITPAQGSIQADGTASATYQATAPLSNDRVVALVDNDSETTGSNVVPITVNNPITPTDTPMPATDTPTSTPIPPTNTATATPTSSPTDAPTNTSTPTNTPTDTPRPPTNTPTSTPTHTAVPPSMTPTNAPTNTPTDTPVPPTNTPTSTPTNMPTSTPPPSDTIAPVVHPAQSPAANANGWNKTDVTVTWNWADTAGGSGIDSSRCVTSGSSSGEGILTLNATCTDRAGNTAAASYTVKVDKTAPTLNPSVVPNPVRLNGSAVASPNASDSTSDSVSASCGVLATSSVGAKSVACSATDNAGNTASANASYTVIYNFSGFFSPVANPPTLNQVSAAKGVVLTFSLAGNQGLNILAATFPASRPIDCNTLTPLGVYQPTKTSKNGFKYNAKTQQYSYSWMTDKAWIGTCRQFDLKLNDGTEHLVNFKFTK